MKINTYQFGEIEYQKNQIIFFEQGLFGFEDINNFLFIKTDEELFYWLNAIEKPEIAFPMISLRIIDENFPVMENCEAFGIVTFSKNPADITVNLKSPIYINLDKKIGLQKIIDNDKYPIDYNLFVKES